MKHSRLTGFRRTEARAFTMVEVLVVISLILVLIALLVPALFAATSTADRTRALSNLRQVGTWMQLYSQENKTFILPSRFNYSDAPYPPRLRSNQSNVGRPQFEGTWTDILWTLYADMSFPPATEIDPGNHDYRYDSPDDPLFQTIPDVDVPFRSAALNSRGNRAVPGYFAANNFFTAIDNGSDPDFTNWYTHSQIARPARSMYIIDSWSGEYISPVPASFDFVAGTSEVDFRYQGEALVLFLDNHVAGESKFDTLDELENVRDVRVRDLHRRP